MLSRAIRKHHPVDAADARFLPLRVGISTRALFDIEEEHAVFEERGLDAYVRTLRSRENARMAKGAGFEVVSRLLGLNEPDRPPLVEVVLMSRNAPDASLRVFASVAHYGLTIATGSFTGGGAIAPLMGAWGIDLFLSKDTADVEAAHAAGVAAGKLGAQPQHRDEAAETGELRIAFDGDAVVFSDESDQIFARKGLEAFLRHEVDNARDPMAEGPFGGILRKLAALREESRLTGRPRIRTALVTARTAPAHARVVHTLRAWGVAFDEAHFVGEGDKGQMLAAFGAHIFFDDQERHIVSASRLVPAAQVPGQRGLMKDGRDT